MAKRLARPKLIRWDSGYTPADGYSQSMLMTWQACRQRMWNQFHGWEIPSEKMPLLWGNLIHALLHDW